MKNLNRYTVTALWLADFLSEPIRCIIMDTCGCTSLTDADKLLDTFCAEAETESMAVLHTNVAAMAKIADDCRIFGFAESELSRRLRIADREHTSKITVITWSYTLMVALMLKNIDPAEKKLQPKLTAQLYDKAKRGFRTIISSLIANGCYATIDGAESRYLFFGASAGQMRKERFVLLREDVYNEHNEALCLGLTEEKINDAGGMQRLFGHRGERCGYQRKNQGTLEP